jgi:hypothetical protein
MTDVKLRPELPPMPDRMKRLPLSPRGYPVPRFVQWMDDGEGAEFGVGTPDFRIMDDRHLVACVKRSLCWVCGQRLGAYKTFVIGPMCAVNRISAEPPSHLDCATWSAMACPFLSRPHARRRIDEVTGPLKENVTGMMIERNPGVTLCWTTLKYRAFRPADGGLLFNIGEADHCEWYREGRSATREEVSEAIDTGLPTLVETTEGRHLAALEWSVARARGLMPT